MSPMSECYTVRIGRIEVSVYGPMMNGDYGVSVSHFTHPDSGTILVVDTLHHQPNFELIDASHPEW